MQRDYNEINDQPQSRRATLILIGLKSLSTEIRLAPWSMEVNVDQKCQSP